ncbi:MAG TPA: GNAT family N-acetyltransferase [Chitinophagaceae bacterium]|nr:GNAT family N-acetyltransferase [Chitinophagaceae bacterium]HQV84392.1 GNAT family N-acetyltransferase [Chitinophagaceae bacterium]HQZ76206.1 GNAT family N-acetyltransferase [Chitinophagaceae bacterium]
MPDACLVSPTSPSAGFPYCVETTRGDSSRKKVSAVCNHPDYRGRGYAKALMLWVMQLILENSFTPFLHVLSSNTGAIQLYESIGYRIRKQFFMDVVKRL